MHSERERRKTKKNLSFVRNCFPDAFQRQNFPRLKLLSSHPTFNSSLLSVEGYPLSRRISENPDRDRQNRVLILFFEEKRLKNALGRRRFPFPVFAVRISSTYNIESNETFTDETINDDDDDNSDHDEFVTVKFLLNKPKKSYLPDSVQRIILFISQSLSVYQFICLSVKYFLSVERRKPNRSSR